MSKNKRFLTRFVVFSWKFYPFKFLECFKFVLKCLCSREIWFCNQTNDIIEYVSVIYLIFFKPVILVHENNIRCTKLYFSLFYWFIELFLKISFIRENKISFS